ncbi:MAG: Uma2 family endonuclease, partial [Myxococcales bacterium]|nr:Uma2 family endonuclease [Myxococcales bacterium]
MGEPQSRIATYDDVLAAPDGMTAEILLGELHLSPRPSPRHQRAASVLGGDLVTRFDRGRDGGPGGWIVLHEVELHLGHPDPRSTVVVPDLCAWRRERLPETPDTPAIEVRPDWVCEVLSPGARDVRRDRLVKTEVYHQAGVPWLWIVDPRAHTVEVFQHHTAGYL